jgi:aminoglycoside/choline kinase family phosphotransferase
VRSLATMHAAWWNDDRLASYAFVHSPAKAPWPQFNDASVKATWPIVLERFGDDIPERIKLVCERWSEIGPVIMEDALNHPSTLCHGDMRLDNIFFHEDGSLSILDWQLANSAVGTNDMAYFVSQSLSTEDRRSFEQELLHLYHDTLVDGGVADYTFDDVWTDYRRMLVFCLAYPITAGAGELANDRAFDLCRTMLKRSIAAVTDTDADELVLSR